MLSKKNKSKLISIYVKCLALIAYFVFFSNVFWAKIVGGSTFFLLPIHNSFTNSGFFSKIKSPMLVVNKLELHLINIESSLMRQIGKLAKKLESLVLMIFQPSSKCQLLVIPSSHDQMGNVVMEKSLGKTTNSKTVMVLGFSISSNVIYLENILEKLTALVLSLLACFDSLVLAGDALFKPLS
ncbi:hypothetical protein G9A89_012379 [Geosiphon pyriformis]|nr:hypothetical protein G9A89_012379 [Geosiphon pyriformis]